MLLPRCSLLRACLSLGLILALANAAGAQVAPDVSLYGTVTHSTGATTRVGDRVVLYSLAKRQFFGPALTDNRGTYYFYELDNGYYLVRVYVNGVQVWQNEVRIEGEVRYDIAITVSS